MIYAKEVYININIYLHPHFCCYAVYIGATPNITLQRILCSILSIEEYTTQKNQDSTRSALT